jgi:uncharacterized protein YegP (UPF0339 family)
MPARFEMYKDKAGRFRFRLVAANGEIIAASEAYESKEGCSGGIESVRTNAPEAEIVELDLAKTTERACPGCGATIAEDSKFCDQCGSWLGWHYAS